MINLINEKNNGEIVLKLINENLVFSVHDVSNGGLIISLCEMSMGNRIGVKVDKPKKVEKATNKFKIKW